MVDRSSKLVGGQWRAGGPEVKQSELDWEVERTTLTETNADEPKSKDFQ